MHLRHIAYLSLAICALVACSTHRATEHAESMAAAAARPKTCGGIAGTLCDKGEICEIPAGMCKTVDAQGACEKQPQVCTDQYLPVCGCDQKTYSNDCMRKKAGAQKDHDGKCKGAQKDVHVMGCPYRGVEGGCLMIDGPDGKTYDISSASPAPRVGYLVVSLEGDVSSGASICMQGTVLKDITWSYTKQRCRDLSHRSKAKK